MKAGECQGFSFIFSIFPFFFFPLDFLGYHGNEGNARLIFERLSERVLRFLSWRDRAVPAEHRNFTCPVRR